MPPKTFVTGVTATVANMEALKKAILHASADVAKEYSEDVILDAKSGFVPVDTGALRESGFVGDLKFVDDTQFRITSGFGQESVKNPKTGNPTSDYAWVQHETNPNGKDKYLQTPANQRMVQVKPDLEREIAKMIAVISSVT